MTACRPYLAENKGREFLALVLKAFHIRQNAIFVPKIGWHLGQAENAANLPHHVAHYRHDDVSLVAVIVVDGGQVYISFNRFVRSRVRCVSAPQSIFNHNQPKCLYMLKIQLLSEPGWRSNR